MIQTSQNPLKCDFHDPEQQKESYLALHRIGSLMRRERISERMARAIISRVKRERPLDVSLYSPWELEMHASLTTRGWEDGFAGRPPKPLLTDQPETR